MKAKELIKWLELNPDVEIKIAKGVLDGDTEWATLQTKYENLEESDLIIENGCFKFGRNAEADNRWW